MKLLVHIGLHKTGSTYFQHTLNRNHLALARHGLWYEPQSGYPAHHQAAWQLLLGNGASLGAMIDHADAAACDTLLLSSEDLESVLHDRRAIDTIADTARSRGVVDIEWHVVLRDPGQCFASLHAQLHHHIYADATQLFYDVMQRGFVHFDQPMPGSGTPSWYYSFDHARDLAQLEAATGQAPFAHDYRDDQPFPGWRMLATNQSLPAVESLPGPDARNARMPGEQVAQSYLARLLESVAPAFLDPGRQLAIIDHFAKIQQINQSGVAAYADIVGEHCGPNHRRALARYGADRIAAARAKKSAMQVEATLRKQG